MKKMKGEKTAFPVSFEKYILIVKMPQRQQYFTENVFKAESHFHYSKRGVENRKIRFPFLCSELSRAGDQSC